MISAETQGQEKENCFIIWKALYSRSIFPLCHLCCTLFLLSAAVKLFFFFKSSLLAFLSLSLLKRFTREFVMADQSLFLFLHKREYTAQSSSLFPLPVSQPIGLCSPALHVKGGNVNVAQGMPVLTREYRDRRDTCFCVSYHFNNHLIFISVRLQSVKPAGLVRSGVKLVGEKGVDETLQSVACWQPLYSKSKWKGSLTTGG